MTTTQTNFDNPFKSGIKDLKNQLTSFDIDESAPTSTKLNLDDIVTRKQIRKTFENEDNPLSGLADSIKAIGVMQPVAVWGKKDGSFVLIYGERRFRASRLANKSDIPVLIHRFPGFSEDEVEKRISKMQWDENQQRKELALFEKAEEFQAALDSGMSMEEIVKFFVVKRSKLTKMLSLLKLPVKIKSLVKEGLISDLEVLYAISRIENKEPDKLEEIVEALTQSDQTVSARKIVDDIKNKGKPIKVKPPKAAKTKAEDNQNEDEDNQTEDLFQKAKAKTKTPSGNSVLSAMGSSNESDEQVKDKQPDEIVIDRNTSLKDWFTRGQKAKETASVVLEGLRNGSFAQSGEGAYRLAAFLHGADSDGPERFSADQISEIVK